SAGFGVIGNGYTGVSGIGTSGDGVRGITTSGRGGSFTSTNGPGVYGLSTNGIAGYFTSTNSSAVEGVVSNTAPSMVGVNNGHGVYGESDSGVGGSFQGHAISLYAQNPDIACNSCWAGYFEYNVDVNGTLYANAKSFKIDDPLDPANKYLIHTSVESPDMLDL